MTYIIAEVGVNHNGSVDLAKQSIDAAVDTGADAIKFQTFKTESLVSKVARQAVYQSNNTGKNESQFDMLKRLELSFDDFTEISRYCSDIGVEFLSTPFDIDSANFLAEIGVKQFKIGSGDLTNIPLLQQIDEFGLPVILSTGMSTMAEVKEAAGCFTKSRLTVLHCTSNYPAALPDINLRAMVTMRDELDLPVGYSDHSLGWQVCSCAVALGAQVLEKHFTLDKTLPGPDHKASLDPAEFRDFVQHIRDTEVLLGDGIKRPSTSEVDTKAVARKSIVVTRNLQAGHILTADDLTVKRPDSGLHPRYLQYLPGNALVKPIKADAPLGSEYLADDRYLQNSLPDKTE